MDVVLRLPPPPPAGAGVALSGADGLYDVGFVLARGPAPATGAAGAVAAGIAAAGA